MSREFSQSAYEGVPIPLGLALETIIDEVEFTVSNKRTVPKSKYIKDIDNIYFDVYTLAKDLISSYNEIESITVEIINSDLEELKQIIIDIPELMGFSHIFNSYRFHGDFIRTPKAFGVPVNIIKYRDNTKVKLKNELLHKVMKLQGVETVDVGTGPNVLIYTHHTFYLAMKARRYTQLRVLEHHTGEILDQYTLNKRIKKSTKYDRFKLPFCVEMIQVFGDSDVSKGMSNVNQKIILELIGKWKPETNYKVVQHHITNIKNKLIT